ncbi:MAG: DUF3488 and transglutaminase-like domain-containing protein [Pseudonocardia sp.]|nr:DUF3488 and transglutaminase-like domain-containing protein [Pseudonocardia sp.]
MRSRVAGLGLAGAAGVAGLAFAPAFSFESLAVPVAAVVVAVAAVDLAAERLPRLDPVRALGAAVLGAAAGLLALTLPAAPWGPVGRAVLDGAFHGWLRTLESTFPARPDPELLAFVPLLALIAAVAGVEWLRRDFPPVATLVPSVAVIALAQLFRASTGWAAVLLAVIYGCLAAMVLASGRTTQTARWSGRGLADLAVLALPVLLVAGLGSWGLASADLLRRPAYTVHDAFELVQVPQGAVSPLDRIGGRLNHPDVRVFTARTDAPVDRWPLIVLDGFDGAGWTSSARYRPLGARLEPDPAVTVALADRSAQITLGEGADGPWLPSQQRTTAVDGMRPAVDPATGMLLLAEEERPASYTLHWQAAQPAPDQLIGAAVDGTAPGAVQISTVPAGVVEATKAALGDTPPSFAAALKLEKYLRDNFTVASGADLPTGSGSAHLLDFLTRSKTGTSEQFAAAYVLMARAAGIPARLVVGFRQPRADASGAFVVTNRQAFAWPEVAVTGIGWVPLDPTGGAQENPQSTPPTTQATDAARKQAQQDTLPVPQSVPAPRAAPPAVPAPDGPPATAFVLAAALLLIGLAVITAIPGIKWFRTWRRRRAPAAQAAVNAWLDTRDRLRDHGVAARSSMTVRDVRAPAAAVLNGSSGELERLARSVDVALWAGTGPVDARVADEAWAAASAVRKALGHRPVPERARAAWRLHSLKRIPD